MTMELAAAILGYGKFLLDVLKCKLPRMQTITRISKFDLQLDIQ